MSLPTALRKEMHQRLGAVLQPVALLDDIPVHDPGSVIDWAEDRFYIIETKRPIQLQPIQKAVLTLATERRADGRFRWKTIFYSTIKKSGKTAIAALYQRWAAERWGDYGEIYHMGNKLEQAKERAFKITKRSIELAPRHEQAEWDLQALTMTHIPTRSFIKALPMSASGEAGGNQRLTTWTELHGYIYDTDEQMWTEMMPVPTQFLSQRFVESYAGYIGLSNLLKGIWDLGLAGERLHDEYPILGNEGAGLLAYIDVGAEARRMPWQVGEIGRQYYAEAEATELPHEYERLHENKWTEGQSALIPIELWDRLQVDVVKPPEPRRDVVVFGVDASVSGDCTALVVVAVERKTNEEDMLIRVLEVYEWTPPKGGKIDYGAPDGLKPTMTTLIKKYRPNCIAYDEYQLHDVMTDFQKKHRGIIFYAFPQGEERLEADTKLVHRIRHEQVQHDGSPILRKALQNADGKKNVDDKRLRIVKKEGKVQFKIDPAVALSMGAHKAVEIAQKPMGVFVG